MTNGGVCYIVAMNENATIPGTPVLKLGTTQRGFVRGTFIDRYGQECSIQKSSIIAASGQQCIWLGCNNNNGEFTILPQSPEAQAKHGVGWKEKSLREMFPDCDIGLADRMHLTQEMVRALLPALQEFAETGELPVDKE